MREAELAMMRRLAHQNLTFSSRRAILRVLISALGRTDEALRVSERRILRTFEAQAKNMKTPSEQPTMLRHGVPPSLRQFEEAKALTRKMMLVARRVLGESHEARSR